MMTIKKSRIETCNDLMGICSDIYNIQLKVHALYATSTLCIDDIAATAAKLERARRHVRKLIRRKDAENLEKEGGKRGLSNM